MRCRAIIKKIKPDHFELLLPTGKVQGDHWELDTQFSVRLFLFCSLYFSIIINLAAEYIIPVYSATKCETLFDVVLFAVLAIDRVVGACDKRC